MNKTDSCKIELDAKLWQVKQVVRTHAHTHKHTYTEYGVLCVLATLWGTVESSQVEFSRIESSWTELRRVY